MKKTLLKNLLIASLFTGIGFTSCEEVELPEAKTNDATEITCNQAILNGEVVSDGGGDIIESGFLFGTAPEPDETNSEKIVLLQETGAFSSPLTCLSLNKTYYYKAYTINNAGTSFGEVKSFTTSTDYSTLVVGDCTNGGKVAYIFQPEDPGYINGETHGIIVAWEGFPYLTWGCFGTLLTTAETIGSSPANTNTINASCGAGTAAAYCADYITEGTSDWYLPSIEELNIIYTNRSTIGLNLTGYIWSSTDWQANNPWVKDFSNGNVTGIVKSETLKFVAVSYF